MGVTHTEVVANFSVPAVTVVIFVPSRIDDIVSIVFAER